MELRDEIDLTPNCEEVATKPYASQRIYWQLLGKKYPPGKSFRNNKATLVQGH